MAVAAGWRIPPFAFVVLLPRGALVRGSIRRYVRWRRAWRDRSGRHTGGSYKRIAVRLVASTACFARELKGILIVVVLAPTVKGSFTARSLGSERFGVLRVVNRILLVCSRGEHDLCLFDIPVSCMLRVMRSVEESSGKVVYRLIPFLDLALTLAGARLNPVPEPTTNKLGRHELCNPRTESTSSKHLISSSTLPAQLLDNTINTYTSQTSLTRTRHSHGSNQEGTHRHPLPPLPHHHHR